MWIPQGPHQFAHYRGTLIYDLQAKVIHSHLFKKLDHLPCTIVTMPIQASTGSPMSGSLANGTYETFGGIDIRGDDDPTFFSEHTVYSQVIYCKLKYGSNGLIRNTGDLEKV